LPGNFFLLAGQTKDSVNHCYLSVTIESARCAGGICIASSSLSGGIEFTANRTGGAMADTEKAEGGAADDAAGPTPKGKLKLIIAAAGMIAILGGGAGWFFFFRHHGEEQHAEAPPPPKPPAFIEVPDMLVNLQGQPGERVQYLKVKLTLEVKEAKQVEAITPALPRVTDLFQTYLRELRPIDLNGSAGLFRLKEELTRRVNAAVAPNEVSAVLFKEIVVQ
jgi:flagellar FliL protein